MYQHDAVGAYPQAGYAAMGQAPQGYRPYPFNPYAMVAPAAVDIIGQTPPAEKGTWDKMKDWGDKKTVGVQNKWLVAAAVATGVVWYGYSAHWFGRDYDGYDLDF